MEAQCLSKSTNASERAYKYVCSYRCQGKGWNIDLYQHSCGVVGAHPAVQHTLARIRKLRRSS